MAVGLVLSSEFLYNYIGGVKRMKIAKKTIILYVLYCLQFGTNENQSYSQSQIQRVLGSLGIECDRKTVGRNIKYLTDFGYPIVKRERGKYYYDNTRPVSPEVFIKKNVKIR